MSEDMHDRELERLLRDWSREEAAEPHSADLRRRVATIPAELSTAPRWVGMAGFRSAFGALGWGAAGVAAASLLAVVLMSAPNGGPDVGGAPGAADQSDGTGMDAGSEEKESEVRKMKSPLIAVATATALATSVVAAESEQAGPAPEPPEFAGELRWAGTGWIDDTGTVYERYRVVEMSDPRLDGDYLLAHTSISLPQTYEPVWNGAFRVVNDDGAWEEAPGLVLEFDDGTASTRTSVLVGEGDYDGLVAITELEYVPQGTFHLRGAVVDVDLPQDPTQEYEP